MTFLSVDEQNAAIRRLFPDFRLTANADWIGVWEGPLRPASKTYTIRIVYFRRKFFDGWFLSNSYVTVHVVDPLIGKLMLDGNILPHIYWNDRAPLWPALCLWDPEEMLWDPRYRSPPRSSRGRRSGCCSLNTGRFPVNFLDPGGTRSGDATNVRNLPRLQTRRPALEGRDSTTTNSTGLAEGPAFSDPISGRGRH